MPMQLQVLIDTLVATCQAVDFGQTRDFLLCIHKYLEVQF